MSTHCQIFCPSYLCLGRVQVQLCWFENKNMNANLCQRTLGICTWIIHEHSLTLIIALTLTLKNFYISTPKHTMIHKPQLLCSMLPSVLYILESIISHIHSPSHPQIHWNPYIHCSHKLLSHAYMKLTLQMDLLYVLINLVFPSVAPSY